VRFAPLIGGRLAVILAGITLVSGCAVSPSSRVETPAASSDGSPASEVKSNQPTIAAPVPGAAGDAHSASDAQPPRPGSPSTPPLPSVSAQAVTHALALIGSPYRYGGTGASGIDCSGLVRYSYQLVGITLPRATGEQRAATRRLPPAEALRAGDLVFFSRGKTALHVGIFAGDGRFVHAATRGGGVRLETLAAPHWRQRFLEARRVAPLDGDADIAAVADRH